MRLTIAGLIVALGILTAPLTGAAQQPKKIYRIGYLANPSGPTVEAFRLGLREFGYVIDRFPALAADNRVHPTFLKEIEGAARTLSVVLSPLEARGPDELESAFTAAIRERAGALIVLPDPMFASHRTPIVALAAKKRLPTIYGIREFVDANLQDNFRRAAGYVDKILKGAKPGDLPVEQPTKFELVVNLKTARALGLTIPQSVLIRADQVVQ
ncbi:MAG: ABC transporter substrate-binding protein [Candidatus Rokubacteria bacterium]|nr:ABC transporter substrate-binding protein [Candidatus Rokubacteria bacterium]